MSWELKYLVFLLLKCRLCSGVIIQKCFTLEKVTTTQGDVYYDWENRLYMAKVNPLCPNGLIRFRRMTFSISNTWRTQTSAKLGSR